MAVNVKVVKDKLVIEADIENPGTPSSSGKSYVVATTRGFAPVPGSDLKVSLNVIRPNKK